VQYLGRQVEERAAGGGVGELGDLARREGVVQLHHLHAKQIQMLLNGTIDDSGKVRGQDRTWTGDSAMASTSTSPASSTRRAKYASTPPLLLLSPPSLLLLLLLRAPPRRLVTAGSATAAPPSSGSM